MSEKISLTFENFFPQDISKKIVDYLKLKDVKNAELILSKEKEKKEVKNYNFSEFDSLLSEIQESLVDDGKTFHLYIPDLKTSFEEFSYGIEANSSQKDFRKFFSRYI